MARWLSLVAVFTSCILGVSQTTHAQGLVCKLPEDGTWVRYEGVYKQIETRASTGQADLEINWIQHLTIKSVGKEEAEYQGKKVPCRWLEFKVQTGKKSEAGINPGPVGQAIYKVLVPEHRVLGTLQDADTIPVSFLPIVKGFRKDGNKDTEPIAGSVFQMYPKVALIRHFETLEKEGDPEGVELAGGTISVMAQKWKGKFEAENSRNHTVQEAEIWRSNETPFGLAQWNVKMTMERKEDKEPRSAFKQVSQTVAEMKVLEQGTDAKSELDTTQ